MYQPKAEIAEVIEVINDAREKSNTWAASCVDISAAKEQHAADLRKISEALHVFADNHLMVEEVMFMIGSLNNDLHGKLDPGKKTVHAEIEFRLTTSPHDLFDDDDVFTKGNVEIEDTIADDIEFNVTLHLTISDVDGDQDAHDAAEEIASDIGFMGFSIDYYSVRDAHSVD